MQTLHLYKAIVSYLALKMNKSKARKLGLIFTFSIIVVYFTLLGLLGEEGLLHARSMRRDLEHLHQRQEILVLQVDSLEQQNKLMSSQDALKDAAFRFGYQMEGEQVFYFTDEEDGDYGHQEANTPSISESQIFSGFSKPWIALMALAFSVVFTIGWAIVSQRRDRHR